MRLLSLFLEIGTALRWAYSSAEDPFQERIARSKELIYALMRRARDADSSDHSDLWRSMARCIWGRLSNWRPRD